MHMRDVRYFQIGCCLLVLVHIYVFLVALNYENSWVQPENLSMKLYALREGNHFSWTDFRKMFDFVAFEFAERSTRPLSSLMEIIDSKFRASLWQYMIPHPSLSITLLFTLGLNPLLFYLALRNFGVQTAIGLFSVAMLIMGPGNLSLISMLFRPGKAMANFFIIFILFIVSKLWRMKFISGKEIGSRYFIILTGTVFLACFCDEFSWLLFPMLLLMFPWIFCKRRLSIFLGIGGLIFACYFFVLPAVSASLGYMRPNFWGYLRHWTKVPRLSFLWVDRFYIDIVPNLKALIMESVGVINPFLVPTVLGKMLVLANLLLWVVLIFKITKWYYRQKGEILDAKLGIAQLANKLLWFLPLVFFFHCSSMANAGNRVWGPYWYGTYWMIFFVWFISLSVVICREKILFLAVTLLTVSSNAYLFPHLNKTYKYYHYYPCKAGLLSEVFKWERDRFSVPSTGSGELYGKTKQYWLARRMESKRSISLPKELLYLSVELGLKSYLDPKLIHTLLMEDKRHTLVPTG